MDEKDQEHLMDAMSEGSSNCCGAAVYDPAGDGSTAICKGCGDHCEIEADE